jgi:hypothetical protein
MLFITHALPRTLLVDEVVRIGGNGVNTMGMAQVERQE